MKNAGTTLLGYALLGLLHQKPASGYDLRKIFAETPMGNFSDSPGAIYPALRRLEEKKFVRSVVEKRAGIRLRKLLTVTPAGLSELSAWLQEPLEQADVATRLNEIMLRFSFADSVVGEAGTLHFLQSFEQQLKIYVPGLQKLHKLNSAKMPTSAALALENGVLGYEAQLKWVQHAIAVYKRKVKSL